MGDWELVNWEIGNRELADRELGFVSGGSMRKIFVILALLVTLSACAGPAPVSAPTMTLPPPTATRIPLTSTPTEVLIPTLQPVIQEIRMLSVSGESFQAQVVDDPNTEITMAVRSDVENGFYVIKDGEWVQFDIAHPMVSWGQSTKDQIAASKNPTVAADRYFEQQIQYLLQAEGEDVSLFSKNAEVGTPEWVSINDQKYDIFARWMEKNRIFESSAPNEWIAANLGNPANYMISSPDTKSYGYPVNQHLLDIYVVKTQKTMFHGYPVIAPVEVAGMGYSGYLRAIITPIGEDPSKGQLLQSRLDNNGNIWALSRVLYQPVEATTDDLCQEQVSDLLVWQACQPGKLIEKTRWRSRMNLSREPMTHDKLLQVLTSYNENSFFIWMAKIWFEGCPKPEAIDYAYR